MISKPAFTARRAASANAAMTASNAGFVEFARRAIAFVERDRAGGDCFPAPLSSGNWAPPSCGTRQLPLRPAWASWIAGTAPIRLMNAAMRASDGDMVVAPDSEVAGRDAALSGDGGGFGNHQAGPADGAAAEMDEVPVVGVPVCGAVLAHRRDGDAIAKRNAADC